MSTVLSAVPGFGPGAASSEHGVARRVVLSFLIFGVSWVLVTDLILYSAVHDPVTVARFESVKGTVFVVLAAALLYAMTLRFVSRVARAQGTVSAVVESIADGVLLLGPERTIIHANPAAVRMLRLDERDLVGMGAPEFSRRFRVSHTDGTLLPPEEYVSQRAFREGGPLQHKVVLHPASGDEVVILSTAAAVRGRPGGDADVVVSVMHDVTELERLDRMRDQFLGIAAHSLKTPVTVLRTNAQVLAKHAGHLTRPVQAIERQCGHLERLTENLLVLSRLHAGRLHLYPTELELSPLVEKVVGEMAAAWPGREVRGEVDPGLPVSADAERISLALSNVVDEALRSSDRGSEVTLLSRVRATSMEIGVRCELRAPEEVEHDEFQRYDDLGARRHVAKAIVKAHGGWLRDETSGLSRTTWLCLPLLEGPHGHP